MLGEKQRQVRRYECLTFTRTRGRHQEDAGLGDGWIHLQGRINRPDGLGGDTVLILTGKESAVGAGGNGRPGDGADKRQSERPFHVLGGLDTVVEGPDDDDEHDAEKQAGAHADEGAKIIVLVDRLIRNRRRIQDTDRRAGPGSRRAQLGLLITELHAPEEFFVGANFFVDPLEVDVGGLQAGDLLLLGEQVAQNGLVTCLGVVKGAPSGLDGLSRCLLELALQLLESLAFGHELRVLVRVGLRHLADTDLRGADGRLGGSDVAISTDLRDIPDRTTLGLVAGDDQHENLVFIDLLAGLFAVTHQDRALGRQGIGVLRDREQLLVLDEVIFLLVEPAYLVLEGLNLDSGLLNERIGDHQTVVLTVLLDGFAENPCHLASEVTIRVSEIDIDHQGLSLGINPALTGEYLLLGEGAREDIARLVRLQDLFAFGGSEALRYTFDDIRAAHRLDRGEEVVIRDDLEVVVRRRGPAVDVRRQSEDAQAAGGAIFRDDVVGIQQ